jgi:hypothetical protein
MSSKVLFVLLLTGWSISYGQTSLPTVRTILLHPTKITPIDSMTVLPGSLRCYFKGALLDTANYRINYLQNVLEFPNPVYDTVAIVYVRVNARLTENYRKFDALALQQRGKENLFKIPEEMGDTNPIFGGSEIAKKGSVSRGITFGNQQNLGINSTLNLELNGKLNDRLNLLASVSDANIPIQPDGNTNRLQEFDQVFIQLYNERLKFTAGDFWLFKPQGYFLNYRKRGQGMSNQYQTNLGKGTLSFQSSAGLSKGKFQRQIIQGIENNQGPYRLVGAENEPYIVVLSGTERVYIDGRLMERGQAFDYTIDYNTAEVVFTPKRLITKDVRIVVEFQYSDQSYSRSLFQQNVAYQDKNTKVYLNLYREQDLKNQPLQLNLTQQTKVLLAQLGDSLLQAKSSTLDSVGYFSNQNLYALRDSLGFDSVLVFSVHPDSAKYRASFSQVGNNKGNYVLDKITAFGPVYRWVMPVGNIPQGNYEPIQRIITPKRRTMVSAGIEQKLGEKWSVLQEVSATENALNLFSKKDRANDWGFGNLTKIVRQSLTNNRGWKQQSSAEFEYLSADFNPIEAYRKVEFDRDWNVRGKNYSGAQRLIHAQHAFEHDAHGKAIVRAQYFSIGDQYEAQRLFSEGMLHSKRFSAQWDASGLLSSKGQQNAFIRHRVHLAYQGKKIRVGYKDDQEFNHRDTLTGAISTSYGFFDYQGYLENADSLKNKVRIFIRDRIDYKPQGAGFSAAARGTSFGAETAIKTKNGNSFLSTLAWRKLTPIDSSLLKIAPDQSLVGRAEYNYRGLKGSLVFNSYYELSSGLEQKRAFVYLEVNAGQGTYTWIDYNQDGVKDLNEFELAAYVDQAKYIRVFTPSNAYQKTYGTEFNQSLFWRPEIIWAKKTGILKFLSQISDQFRLRSTRKFGQFLPEELLKPWVAEITNNDLISSNYSLRNTLFLFRTSSKFNGQYEFNKSLTKTLLATGFDGRSLVFHSVLLRWNILPSLSIKTEAQWGMKGSQVDYTSGRNYAIQYQQGSGELSYQPSTHYRIYSAFKLVQKNNNPIYGIATLEAKDLSAGVKYNTSQKGSIQCDVKYLNLKYQGISQGAVVFEMLESLQPGSNYTWSLLWQRNLGKNLQLNLQYSGRKPSNRSVIHNGGMELRAFF